MEKFKFNWGHGLALALISFIIFITTMVYKASSSDTQKLNDTYSEDDFKYQQVINEQKNAVNLIEKPTFSQTEVGLIIHFPEVFTSINTKGNLYLMRPSNKKEDVSIALILSSNNEFIVPKAKMKDGLYLITLDWTTLGESYQIKESLTWKAL